MAPKQLLLLNNTCVLYIQKYLDYSLLDSRRISNNIRKLLIENYSWDKTAKKFEDIFDNLEMTGLQGKWESPILDTQPKNMVHDISNNREFVSKSTSSSIFTIGTGDANSGLLLKSIND